MLSRDLHLILHAAPWPTEPILIKPSRTHVPHRITPTTSKPHPHPIPPPPGPYGKQPRHGGTNHLMENYGSVMQTPQGNVRNPYQSCGNTHSSGPASMPSTSEPMHMAMGANPPDVFKDNYLCDGGSGGTGAVNDGCPVNPIGNEGCACNTSFITPDKFFSPCQCYPTAKNEGECVQVHDWLKSQDFGY